MQATSMNIRFSPLQLSSQRRSPARRVSAKATRRDLNHAARHTPAVTCAEVDSSIRSKAVATLVAGALLLSSVAPDAAEAAKSAGRAGGRSFASRSRPAPRAQAPRSSVSTTNVIVAPPVYGGFSPFGFGGFGFSPFGFGFGVPMFGFGAGILQLMLGLFVLQFLFSMISGFFTGRSDDDSSPPPPKKDNFKDFDDF